jgi:hypothetical protein
LSGGRFEVPLPALAATFEYSADGKTLYAIFNDPQPSIERIELDGVRRSPIPGSRSFQPIHSLVPSATGDRLFISGGYTDGTSPRECGIFTLTFATGMVRKIAEKSTCDYISAWTTLSVSPDNAKIIARENRDLEIINPETAAARRLGTAFEEGRWSPDGRWLAVVDYTVAYGVRVLDAGSLKEKMVVKGMIGPDVRWSPDSRYLLGFKEHDLCGPYAFTLETVDLDTGLTSTIWSSWCKVNLATIGWVASTIQPRMKH